jgi:DNA gyrase subunit B
LIKMEGKKTYSAAQLKEIMQLLVEAEHICEILKRRNINMKDLLSQYDSKTKKFPKYTVKIKGKVEYVFDDKDLAELTKDDEESQYVEIFEAEELAEIQTKLAKHELDLQDYEHHQDQAPLLAKDKKEQSKNKSGQPTLKALFSIEDEKDIHELFSLEEITEFIRAQAKKGMHTQRYKGLGEMNPQQLWDTTMDPQRRTILKVTLEDVVEVDKTFSILMGDAVEPRRQFIEAYAHEVKNLDI